MIPVVVLLQYCFYNQQTSLRILFSLLLLSVGVVVATVEEFEMHPIGMSIIALVVALHDFVAGAVVAGCSTIAMATCHIFISSKQKELNLSPLQVGFDSTLLHSHILQLLYKMLPLNLALFSVLIPSLNIEYFLNPSEILLISVFSGSC